jgi:Ca2+-binding EF-hand superfamily protein
MISGISSTSSLSYLLQMQKSSTQNDTSTDDIFSQLDSNGDGTITKSEFEKAQKEWEAAFEIQLTSSSADSTSSLLSLLLGLGQAGGMDGSLGMMPGAQGAGEAPPPEEIYAKIDTDGNGTVSKAEFENGRPDGMSQTQADDLFAKLDTDGDGNMSKSEFVNGRPDSAAMQGQATDTQTDLTSALLNSLLQHLEKSESSTSTSTDQGTSSGAGSLLSQVIASYLQSVQVNQIPTATSLFSVAA